MNYVQKLGLGLLLIPVFIFSNIGSVSAANQNQIVGAMRSIEFCTTNQSWRTNGSYDADAQRRINAFCQENNAAELAAACDGDIRNLDDTKYYTSDSFFLDLCALANEKDPDTGYGATGGNNELDAQTPEVAATSELSILADIVRQAKAEAGCYPASTAIPTPAICALTVTKIIDICESGEINQPQYVASVSMCQKVGTEARRVYGDQGFATITQTAQQVENPQADDGIDDSTCDSNVELDLSWLICPVIKIAGSVINWMDTQIAALLSIDENKYKGDTLYAAWSQIRNISYIILIPIMLVMVIGTALGFDFFSAYTIKRALPRMVAAVIFITFSWYVTGFLIDLSNVVGSGIMGLMTAPFGNIMGSLNQLSLADLFQADGDSLYATILAQMGISVGTIVLLALFFPSMAAIVATGFFILLLRQMFIVALVLVAPLAILAWIFPGNDKLWKLWWDAFTKLLMMFPIIMAIIAVGRIFAVLIVSTQAGFAESAINPIATVAAYILPYAFIPFTFRLAGGVFATLTGMVNDREKGFFDKQRQKRAEKRERAGANKFFNPNGRLNRLNSAAGWMADPKNSARIKLRTRGGKSLAADLTQKSAQQSQDLAKWMSSAGFNQEALTAIMKNVRKHGGNYNAAAMDQQIKALEASGSTQDRAAAKQLKNYSGYLQDVYRSEDFNRANIGMAAGLAKASQGFINNTQEGRDETADYANFLNTLAPGLGESFKTTAGLMSGQSGGLGKVGYSEQVDTNGKYVQGGVASRAVQLSRSSVRDITGAKASALKKQFLGSGGAFETIMNNYGEAPDPVTGEMTKTVVDRSTGEEIKVNETKRIAVLDNIAQAAYGFDTPAETAAALREELARLKGPLGADGKATTEMGKKIEQAEFRAQRGRVPDELRDGPAPGPADDDH